jgi:hypothetical protein
MNGQYAGAPAPSQHPARSTAIALDAARAATSAGSRDLPIPRIASDQEEAPLTAASLLQART